MNDISVWEENGTVHLKCVTPQGDPVELNMEEIKELMNVLEKYTKEMDLIKWKELIG